MSAPIRLYSAKTDRKVGMFFDAFHSVHDVFGWSHAVAWWDAAAATMDRECWEGCPKCDDPGYWAEAGVARGDGTICPGCGEPVS